MKKLCMVFGDHQRMTSTKWRNIQESKRKFSFNDFRTWNGSFDDFTKQTIGIHDDVELVF